MLGVPSRNPASTTLPQPQMNCLIGDDNPQLHGILPPTVGMQTNEDRKPSRGVHRVDSLPPDGHRLIFLRGVNNLPP